MSNLDFDLAESLTTTNASYFIAIYIIVLIYCCFGLAVVCDVYFVPALQKLSYTYDLPPDIAGSTLMALGASVPELFASLIGVFVTEDDIGTGSIIGSSCFNLIAVPAACAFVASASFSRKLTISPIPVIRNSAFYAITILVLLLIIKDNKVDIPEAMILLLFFVMYMAFMIVCAKDKSGLDQGANSAGQLQNSLNNSYISNDSAIATSECGKNKWQYSKIVGLSRQKQQQQQQQHHANQDQKPLLVVDCNNNENTITNNNNNNNNNNHPQQAVYGQFYFDNPQNVVSQFSVPLAAKKQMFGANERTPLKGTGGNYGIGGIFDCQNNNNNNAASNGKIYNLESHACKLYHSSQPANLDSCSIDLGFAVKNSACLVKRNRHGLLDCDGDDIDNMSFDHHHQQGQQPGNFEEESGWLHSYWVLLPMFPLTLSLKLLTPCKFKNTCWTIWTFIVSIGLIGALTYVSVWMVHLLGQAMEIPETVAGMTILSWGTGIPELIASIVLIKKTAQADMAICNTIGSNVIDASFCLSVPWIIKCIMNKAAGERPEVEVQSAALPWTSFTLFLSVVILLLVLKFHNWQLSCSVGVWLLATYATFVGVATYLESTYSKSGLDLLSMM